jgi:predicted kinase
MSKNAVLFIGLPGAGKSTVVKERYSGYEIVSADTLKETHPDYDPKNPEIIHEWSVSEAEKMMGQLSDEGKDICMDSGGVNNSYSLRIMNMLKSKGYHLTLVHVDTPPHICFERNKSRERQVPEAAIFAKAQKLEDCLIKQKAIVDEFVHIPYFTNKNIFIDMDGVLAHYQKLVKDDRGNVDYVNYNIFLRGLPVKPVIDTLYRFEESRMFILSASPNSFCNQQKTAWLKEHFPIVHEDDIIFVGKAEYKPMILGQLLQKYKIDKKDCTFIDDFHELLAGGLELGVNAMHPSEFLAKYYKG